ncbi:MAG: alpha/beta hydrolase [Emcibacteraceae bacterium]|nr:alpha/beta hydrolase [Emcibacteraceae bacterium]
MLRKILKLLLLSIPITIAAFFVIGWQSYGNNMAVSEHCNNASEELAANFFEDVETIELLSRNDNVTLSGRWLSDEEQSRVVVMTHGLEECLSDARFIAAARLFHEADFSVLMVEMRNHGTSERTNGLHGFGSLAALDLLGAWDWVKKKGYSKENIAVYGQSLGGAAALHAGILEPVIATIVADSPMTRIDWVLSDGGAPEPFISLLKLIGNLHGFNLWRDPADGFLNDTKQRVLVIHSITDNVTPVKHARYLVDNNIFADTKIVIEVDDTPHVALAIDHPAMFEEIVIKFIESLP